MKSKQLKEVISKCGNSFAEVVQDMPIDNVSVYRMQRDEENNWTPNTRERHSLDELPTLQGGEWFIPAILDGHDYSPALCAPPWLSDTEAKVFLQTEFSDTSWGENRETTTPSVFALYIPPHDPQQYIEHELQDFSNALSDGEVSEHLHKQLNNLTKFDDSVSPSSIQYLIDSLKKIQNLLEGEHRQEIWQAVRLAYETGIFREKFTIPNEIKDLISTGLPIKRGRKKKGPRLNWTSKALEIIQDNPSIKNPALAKALEEAEIIFTDDDWKHVHFEEESSSKAVIAPKSWKAFAEAVRRLRKDHGIASPTHE